MVKSKKMSKTSIAVIVLALLLVLSLVMGITGAWFSSKVENTEVESSTFGFGEVKITGTGATAVTYDIYEGNVLKMTDGDVIHVANTLAITNASTVKILYIIDQKLDVQIVSAGTKTLTVDNIEEWFDLEDVGAPVLGHVDAAAGTISVSALGAGDYDLDSDGAANGNDGTFKIVANAKVYAVQTANLLGADKAATLVNVKEAFQAAGYAGYNDLTQADLITFGLYNS